MLTLRTADDAATVIDTPPGHVLTLGIVIPANLQVFTAARILVVADLARRLLEDVHGIQVFTAIITEDAACGTRLLRSDLLLRPPVGLFTSRAAAETSLGRALQVVFGPAGFDSGARLTVAVAPVRSSLVWQGLDLASVRFALAATPHRLAVYLTGANLAAADSMLAHWRHRMAVCSHSPSRPIPTWWRQAVQAAFDDDLDVTAAAAATGALEASDTVAPGATFEALAWIDRVLAVDLARGLSSSVHDRPA